MEVIDMKYMTKDWYKTMQKEVFCGFMEIDNKADKFSEKYFRKLYKEAREKVLREFEERYENRVIELKEKLPDYILNDVQDIRILALDHATENVYKQITERDEEIRFLTEKAFDDYYEDPNFQDVNVGEYHRSFHDSYVIGFEVNNNNCIIELDNEGAFTDVTSVIFKNAKIIKQDGNLLETSWLYEEIYKLDDEYEIHILLRDENLHDLILRCSDIEFKR